MTETLDTTYVPPVADHRSHRLNRALAWVGIAAGSLFIVATVFFSGYVIGQQSGGGHHGRHAMIVPRPPMGPDGRMTGPGGGPRAERLMPTAPPPEQPTTPARP